MTDNIKLSIIIPYYETYDLTEKLLKHLQLQLTKQIEIILIDDSCNETRLDKFKSITIIHHEENKGVAKTRNEGISLAKGEYIGFIDCDDMITSDYIERLLKAINETPTEIINFNWADFNENKINRKPTNYAPWKAIYKKEILPLFREDRPFGKEDIDLQQYLDEKKFPTTYLDRVLYIYNSHRIGCLTDQREQQEKATIRAEATMQFTLRAFKEIKDVRRVSLNTIGELYVGDTFTCTKQMADYLLDKGLIKVIEVFN